MSDINWEEFRFPCLPIGYYLEEARAEQQERENARRAQVTRDDPGQNEELEEENPSAPIESPIPAWVYLPTKKTLHNAVLKQQIKLTSLNTNSKIVRLIEAIEARLPDVENSSLLIALEAAAQNCYQQSLLEVIKNHHFQTITWEIEPSLKTG